MKLNLGHNFHIPVMGLGYTIDTPVQVAQYGISSTISLVDDTLIERMREFYCKKLDIPFQEISDRVEDFRAKRITSYLNLVDDIVRQKFAELKHAISDREEEFEKYIALLPDFSEIKQRFNQAIANNTFKSDFIHWVNQHLPLGSIDVNIMTKLDRIVYDKEGNVDPKMNDAHAALRGFAQSKLSSSLVLSAGMSPRLYTYLEDFEDFYPNAEGVLPKKIILKVSDFRSASVQGKMLAKKGLWISEYRIESGLNCGGHVFPTEGILMGPILEEFRINREQLIEATHKVYVDGLKDKGKVAPETPYEIKITAQGGVGTADEHNFLVEYYNLDAVGWGSPFMLVPEVVAIDKDTVELLRAGGENDYYLSGSSPLGVQFSNIRGASMSIVKQQRADAGKPGAPCTKQFLKFNTEYTERPICTSSRQFQTIKIEELKAKNLPEQAYNEAYEKIIERECLCVGLGVSMLKARGFETAENEGVTVCPGPNLAYFSKISTLKEMVDHIYGRVNLITHPKRPNMFVKELLLYVEVFQNRLKEEMKPVGDKQLKALNQYKKNMLDGIAYYKNLYANKKESVIADLERIEREVSGITLG